MEPTIRPATSADLTEVHRIETSCYSDPWSRSIFYLMRGRAPDLFLVADSSGSVFGYAIGEFERREGVKIGHIMNVAVIEVFRRRGLAGKLMDELERRFMDGRAEVSYLEVRVSNIQAQSLYRKRGYVEGGVLPGYYHDEDGLAMEKFFT